VSGKSAHWPDQPAEALPKSQALVERPSVTELEIFGRPSGDILTVFGSHRRTMAVMLVASMVRGDASTIARIADVQTDRSMHQLLDPIEADGIFVSQIVGSIRLYSLADMPWAQPLRKVVQAIVAERPKLVSRIAPGEQLLLTGRFSNRVHLRRWLGIDRTGAPPR
jgi:hypothetical protein